MGAEGSATTVVRKATAKKNAQGALRATGLLGEEGDVLLPEITGMAKPALCLCITSSIGLITKIWSVPRATLIIAGS